MKLSQSLLVAIVLASLSPSVSVAGDGNRLTYLDERAPFYVGPGFPKLTTPMWFGEEGVEAVIILSIDDMRAESVGRYREFLAPILERLEEIQGESPLSIFCNTVDPSAPQLQSWLEKGVRFDVHTRSHPCPLLSRGFEGAVAEVLDNIANLGAIAGTAPAAYRMPCCDSINSASPRFFSQIVTRKTPDGAFLRADSSIPVFPAESYRKYAPFSNYTATVTSYPYPFVVGGLIWEFPIVVPSDWQAQNLRGVKHAQTVAEIQQAVDLIVEAKGVYTWCFHPHGWIDSTQVVEVIDYAVEKHGRRVRFLNFHQALGRIEEHLLGGGSLRDAAGADNGVRLLDLDADGYLDVVIGNDSVRQTRIWRPAEQRWETADFPFRIVSGGRPAGVCFGVLQESGRASALVAGDTIRALAHFEAAGWKRGDSPVLANLKDAGAAIETTRDGKDGGVRLRDLDGDGLSDLIVNTERQNACWRWKRSARRFERLPFALPAKSSIVDEAGRDQGLRFVDLDGDAHDDLVLSNDDIYYVYLWKDLKEGWSRRALHGPAGSSGALPKTASGGRDTGAWFHDGVLYVANEDTAGKPDLVDLFRFDKLLENMATPPPSPEEARRRLHVRDGFRVELVAAEPLLTDPVSIEFGLDGRLWVTEMGSYPRGEGDDADGRVKFLRDTDGDGRLDEATLFAEGLSFPTGAFPFRDGVLVTCAPDILYLEDTDLDGRADVREVVFTGFGEGNQQHRVNGLHYGLDNWIYGANGDSGGTIANRTRPDAPPVSIRGRDFRFRPSLAEFEAETGNTQYGLALSDWGDRFGCSNARHILHAVLPERYSRRNPSYAPPRSVLDIADHGAMARIFQVSRQLISLNDIHVPGHFSSACGITLYRGGLLEWPTSGTSLYVCEPVGNIVHRDVVERQGATWVARRGEQEREFLASTDSWFRPVYATTGPDGALYIVDMCRWVIEHPDYIPRDLHRILDFGAGRDRGRLWRVVPSGFQERRDVHPDLAATSSAELVPLLENRNGWVRDAAQRLLVARQAVEVEEELRALARTSPSASARSHALWTLEGLARLTESDLLPALRDEDSALRVQAFRLAETFLPEGGDLDDVLADRSSDAVFDVRFQAALTLGESHSPKAAAALARLLRSDLEDSWMRAAVLTSAREHAPALLAELFAGRRPLDLSRDEVRELLADLIRTAAREGSPESIGALCGRLLRDGEPRPWQASLFVAIEETRGSEFFSQAVTHFPEGVGEKFLQRLREAARGWAATSSLPLSERADAVAILAEKLLDGDDLATSLLSPSEPPELQLATLRSLIRLVPRAGGRAEKLLLAAWSQATPKLRGEIVEAFFAFPGSPPRLLDAIEDGTVRPADLPPGTRDRLLAAGEGVARRATELLALPSRADREAVVARYRRELADRDGDETAGEAVFREHCAQCHRLRGVGQAVGPDIASTAIKDDAVLLEAILNPSGLVPPRYRQYLVALQDGRHTTGLIESESATALALLRPHGVREEVLREDVATIAASPESLMPAALEEAITPQAMADLLAFIRAVPADLDRISEEDARRAMRRLASAPLSGFASVVRATERADQRTWLGTLPMALARQLDGTHEVAWKTAPVTREQVGSTTTTFRFPVALGYVSQPSGSFTLWLGNAPLLSFDVDLDGGQWTSKDGLASLRYLARARNAEDSTGIMTLEVASSLLTPGEPALLRVTGSESGSRRWFGILRVQGK